PPRSLFAIVLLKVFGQGILHGTLASYVFLFSLGGSLAGLAAMLLTQTLFTNRISMVGISIAGALVSNVVQLALSVLLVFGQGAWIIAPVFLLAGTIAGLIVGIVALYFQRNSRWLAAFAMGGCADSAAVFGKPKSDSQPPADNNLPLPIAAKPWLQRHVKSAHIFAVAAVSLVAFLLQANLCHRFAMLAVFFMLAFLNGKKIRFLFMTIMMLSIVFFHLLQPAGLVIYQFGRFPVTSAALSSGVSKGLTILGMIAVSLFAVRSDMRLPGWAGSILGRTLLYFERILEYRNRIQWKSFVESVDSMLYSLYDFDDVGEASERMNAAESEKTSLPGFFCCLGLLVISVVPIVIFTFLG
ncbi:MAG: Gx transporter family protein, partial [Spirochaetaceae bacterium]